MRRTRVSAWSRSACTRRALKLEGSAFNGREPDDYHFNFDYQGARLDSYSARRDGCAESGASPRRRGAATCMRHDRLETRTGMQRYGASVLTATDRRSGRRLVERRRSGASISITTEVAPHNHEPRRPRRAITSSASALVETTYGSTNRRDALRSARAGAEERPTISGFTAADLMQLFTVRALSLGGDDASSCRVRARCRSGSERAGRVNLLPETLEPTYGTRTPLGCLRVLAGAADANARAVDARNEPGGWIEITARRIINSTQPSIRCARLFNYFLRGLVVVVPLALTLYVCVVIFTTIDSWLRLPIRASAFCSSLVLITLVGVHRVEPRSRQPDRRRRSHLRAAAVRAAALFVGEGHAQRVRRRKAAVRQAGARVAVGGRLGEGAGFLTSDSLASLGVADHGDGLHAAVLRIRRAHSGRARRAACSASTPTRQR